MNGPMIHPRLGTLTSCYRYVISTETPFKEEIKFYLKGFLHRIVNETGGVRRDGFDYCNEGMVPDPHV